MLWAARRPFVTIILAFVIGAAAITRGQTPLYSSEAMLAIRGLPRTDADQRAALKTQPLAPNGIPYDANDPQRQTGPGRYAPRLTAPGLVTLAARDAGVIGLGDALDQLQASRWVEARAIEGSDMFKLTVKQPTAEGAERLARALVARGLEAYRREEAGVPTRQMLAAVVAAAAAEIQTGGDAEKAQAARDRMAGAKKRLVELDLIAAELQLQLVVVDPPTRPSAPSVPRTSVNLSVGFALGVLAASAFVAVWETLRRAS